MKPIVFMVRQRLLPCLLSLLIVGCEAREPEYVGDPQGVNRNGKPQVIIRGEDVRLNGVPIKQYQTKATDLIPIIGTDISSQASSDAYWNATGLQIHAAPDDGAPPGSPELIHRFVVWVRQEDDSSKRKECDELWRKRHRDSVKMSLESLDRFEQKNGFPRDEQARVELRNEPCSMPGKTPEHAFSGYLEVDGMPIGPNMSLKEVQAQRKRLGLQPLYMNSSPQIYLALKHKTGFEADQTWYFEVSTNVDGDVIDQRLKSISIP